MIGRTTRIRREDFSFSRVADLSPARLDSILSSAQNGYPRDQNDAIDKAIERDPGLAVYETRLMGVTGLEWEVCPARTSDDASEKQAKEIADYCTDQLGRIVGLDDALKHLSGAIGRGYAVAELVWTLRDGVHEIADIVPVHYNQVVGATNAPWRLAVMLGLSSSASTSIDTMPLKFVTHVPGPIGGNPFRGGMLRRCLPIHMIRNYGLKWWVEAIEIFGMPFRAATYSATATPEDKNDLLSVLADFGSSTYGIFPPGTELKIHDVGMGRSTETWPQKGLIEKVDEWYSIRLLGQTLTTRMDDAGGSFAAANVHNLVRRDLLLADIKAESTTITQQVIKPMVLSRFGAGVPMPIFRRVFEAPKDIMQVASVLSVAVNQLGMNVSKGYAHAELGIPLGDGENLNDPIPGQAQPPPTSDLSELFQKKKIAAVDAQVPRNIGRQTSPVSLLSGWIERIVREGGKQARTVASFLRSSASDAKRPEDLLRAMTSGIERIPSSGFAELVRQFILASHLAGRLNARRFLEPRIAGKSRTVHAERVSQFTLDFLEAIDAMSERLLLTPDDFLRLDTKARSRAGRIAGEFNLSVVVDAYKNITETLASGGTVRDFMIGMDGLPDRNGWDGENPWHATLVFLQNASMSYGAGHYQQFRDSGVTHFRFKTYRDSCPICSPMSGLVFSMDDLKYYPPLHFNCDCLADPILPGDDRVTVVSSGDVRNEDYEQSQKSPSAFRYNPSSFGRSEPFDMSGVPDDLVSAFARFVRSQGWDTR